MVRLLCIHFRNLTSFIRLLVAIFLVWKVALSAELSFVENFSKEKEFSFGKLSFLGKPCLLPFPYWFRLYLDTIRISNLFLAGIKLWKKIGPDFSKFPVFGQICCVSIRIWCSRSCFFWKVFVQLLIRTCGCLFGFYDL